MSGLTLFNKRVNKFNVKKKIIESGAVNALNIACHLLRCNGF